MAELNIFTETTLQNVLSRVEEQNTLLKIIADTWTVNDWKVVQMLVRTGLGAKYFPVGTEFNVATQNYGTLVFVVVAHDHHKNPDDETAHTMTLLMRDVIYNRQFDAPELLWANTTDAEIPAGTTLHFTAYKNDYRQDTQEDGTFQFTTPVAIPVNGGFAHSNIGIKRSSYSVDAVLSGTFTVYDADGNALASDLSTTLGTDGTDLGTFSVAYGNISATIGKANSSQRVCRGSSNWKESGIRQWLNGTGTAWWTRQTAFDMKPSYASNLGFLEEIGGLATVLGETELVTARSTLYEYDGILGGECTTRDKLFLLSIKEVGFGDNNGISEGSLLEYYNSASTTDRIKYDYSNTSTAQNWWLRSPYTGYGFIAYRIMLNGYLSYREVTDPDGAVAACVIM